MGATNLAYRCSLRNFFCELIRFYGTDQITLFSARPETQFLSAKWQDGRYAALAVRLINQSVNDFIQA